MKTLFLLLALTLQVSAVSAQKSLYQQSDVVKMIYKSQGFAFNPLDSIDIELYSTRTRLGDLVLSIELNSVVMPDERCAVSFLAAGKVVLLPCSAQSTNEEWRLENGQSLRVSKQRIKVRSNKLATILNASTVELTVGPYKFKLKKEHLDILNFRRSSESQYKARLKALPCSSPSS